MKINKRLKAAEYEIYNKTTVCKLAVKVEQEEEYYTATSYITGYGSARCNDDDVWDKSFGEQLSLCRAKIDVGRKIEKRLLKYSKRFYRNPIMYATCSEWGFKPMSAMVGKELEQAEKENKELIREENVKAEILKLIPKHANKIFSVAGTSVKAISLIAICTKIATEALIKVAKDNQ